jgi:hypothetical protein
MITWLKQVDNCNKTLSDFKLGDLVNYWLIDGKMYVGEVVGIEHGHLITHFLQRQEQYSGKLWRFDDASGIEHEVPPGQVIRHVHHDKPLTKTTVREAWDFMGFCVGVEDYCLKEDEDDVPLDMTTGDSDEEPDNDGYEYDGFVVPDDEGEPFSHPNPDNLTEEHRAWVNETHAAVRDWNMWTPQTDSEKAVKQFVDNLSAKVGHQEDDRKFVSGGTVDFHCPKNV